MDLVEFTLFGQPFMAINAGPLFRFNPSISFMVNFDPLFFGSSAQRQDEARRQLDEVWEKLSAGGKALMPIGQYPFSERYGWIEDKYGLSWQLILPNPDHEPPPPILPSLMFTKRNYGNARNEEAGHRGAGTGVRRRAREAVSHQTSRPCGKANGGADFAPPPQHTRNVN